MCEATSTFSLVKDIVLIVGAIVGIYVAIRGLNTWNRQLRGTNEYDLARRILRAVYRHRDALRNVRNPAIWVNEQPQPPEEEANRMNSQQLHFYGISGAYQKRWDRVTEVRTDLQAELLEAEVLWGKALIVLVDPIQKLERELFLAVFNHIKIINPESDPETKKAYTEIKSKNRDILYEISESDPDDFAKELALAITAIENHLKPHLRR